MAPKSRFPLFCESVNEFQIFHQDRKLIQNKLQCLLLCSISAYSVLPIIFSSKSEVGKLQPMSQIWPTPVFVKSYWNTATLICLCVVCGCFQATTAELSG